MKNLAKILFLALFSQFAFSVHVTHNDSSELELGETQTYFDESTETYTTITYVGDKKYLVKQGLSIEDISQEEKKDIYFNPQTAKYETTDGPLEPIGINLSEKTTECDNIHKKKKELIDYCLKGDDSMFVDHNSQTDEKAMKTDNTAWYDYIIKGAR